MIFKGIKVEDIIEKSEWIKKKRKEPETKSWSAPNLEAEKKERDQLDTARR